MRNQPASVLVALGFGLALLVLTTPLPVRGQEPPAIGWWLVPSVQGESATPALSEIERMLRRLPVKLASTEEIKAVLSEVDKRRGVHTEAGRFLQKGRELHLGLKLPEAIEAYRQSASTLLNGFAVYYDPNPLAEALLQLGAALFQSDQREEARKTFQRVAVLAPRLELSQGYFSPSVRQAFLEAKAELGPLTPGIPSPRELGRITAAAGLRGVVVLSVELLFDKPVLRAGLFDGLKGGFVTLETGVLQEGEIPEVGRSLGTRLSQALADMLGVAADADAGPMPPRDGAGSVTADGAGGAPETADGGGAAGADPDSGSPVQAGEGSLPEDAAVVPWADLDGGLLPRGEDGELAPPDPWYLRHWWIWPAAAAVIGAAVAVPLLVDRHEVVDIRVHF